MKPDGVTTETMEPTDSAVEAELSPSQGMATQAGVTEQPPLLSQPEPAAEPAASLAAQEANGRPPLSCAKVKTAVPKAKPGTSAGVPKTTVGSGSSSRSGVPPTRKVNGVTASNNVAAGQRAAVAKKTGASTMGAVPKRPAGVAPATSSVTAQSKAVDKKPVVLVKAIPATAGVKNVTKPVTLCSTPKRTAAASVNGARPKTTAPASRAATSTAPKPSTSSVAKTERPALSKTTRPATGPPASRSASSTTTSRAISSTAATKTTTTGMTKPASSRVTTAPPKVRTTASQPTKSAPTLTKKDVGSRPATTSVGKKPTTTTTALTKKPELSRPVSTLRPLPASKAPAPTKAANSKQLQLKAQEPSKPIPTKKVAPATALLSSNNKKALGRTPPASPANKPLSSSTMQTKRITKPTQAVPPYGSVKNSEDPNLVPVADVPTAVIAAAAVAVAVAAAAAEVIVTEPTEVLAATPTGALPASQVLASPADTAPVMGPSPTLVKDPPTAGVLPENSLENAIPSEGLVEGATVEDDLPVASTLNASEEPVDLLPQQTPPVSKAPVQAPPFQVIPASNLNEEEDEEEREGSQQVSVSEMSGTTQPTEESRPGSAGPVSGAAWRAGGALLSELDSEEVSGSQQGASELSAPGVLEGTESTDDLGDGSLKGAIDMEGASAGSPDFEKVPEIPANDFEEEEDEDDDNDRVCDMEVGSERLDDLRRPRHDNDVDDNEEGEEEEEDDDVEMASEAVTESGLESYGNADEDDLAEDERLDNLNRVAQLPPPPPPELPSALGAQWDQPNPFADPWELPLEPCQSQQPLKYVSPPIQESADTWQADSETPIQSPAQAWLELGSAPFVPKAQEVPHHSSVQAEPPGSASCATQMHTLAPPAPCAAQAMSLSSTLSSEISTPEELCDNSREGKFQPVTQAAQALPPSEQPELQDLDQDLGIDLGREDEEEEEALSDAPDSNPSSSSTTEDEASDIEGEAQLQDPLAGQGIENVAFDRRPLAQHSLSALEEGEEAEPEGGEDKAESDIEGGDTTPMSLNSAASFGCDTMTTASNSNAPSTGESCAKSPGIFSLEELPEEAGAKPCVIQEPGTPSIHYMQCGEQYVEVSGSEDALDPSPSTLTSVPQQEEQDDAQPPYYSAICEKTENSFAGLGAHPHYRRSHALHTRSLCDTGKPHTDLLRAPGGDTVIPAARLSCADLPPRSPGLQALSPQLRRLEQHQRQLLELQQRREEQRTRPAEEAEQERKRREEEEQRKRREEAEEEIKKNKEKEEAKRRKEEKRREILQLQLQQQQQELRQRQQIMQWQQELEQQQQVQKGQSTVLLSPSSGLCTIYEALENSGEEEEEEEEELKGVKEQGKLEEETSTAETDAHLERVTSDDDKDPDSSFSTQSPPSSPAPPSLLLDSPRRARRPPQDEREDSATPPFLASPECPVSRELDWGRKVDIVQQLINQTLLLTGESCPSLLLLPGGAGGTLSPLESSMWPSLLPPLTPPSATVTSVSSFSPEAPGSSPQGEWTVVELETHH